MKLSCSKQNLINGLNNVQKVISSKTTLPILAGILFEAEDNKIILTGNDLTTAIESTIEANVVENGSIVIPSRIFGDIIRKLPSDNVNIEVTDNKIHIFSENSEFHITGEPSTDYPNLPDEQKMNKFNIPCDLLKNMIEQTIFAISQNDSKPVLMGSLFKINQKELTIVSIDGYRLAIRNANIDSDIDTKVVIPGKALSEIHRIFSNYSGEKNAEISFTDKHAIIIVENVKIITRLLEGEFIQYEKIMPSSFNTEIKINRKNFLNALDRAELMSREGKNNSIIIDIVDEIMCIKSNTEKGNIKEQLNISIIGDDIEIGFNPRYLIDAIKVIDSDIITLKLSSSVSPCLIVPNDYDNYKYIVTPVRIVSSK